MFHDRVDAGRQLARELRRFQADKPLVLGLPRGGVVVGAQIASDLDCDLDVLLVKKLRAPDNPELALGAVCEEGRAFVNQQLVDMTGTDDTYVENEIKERLREIAEQREIYCKAKRKIPAAGRTTILVDDGLATGATMIAAVQATTLARPQKLVVAVPVGSAEAVQALEEMVGVSEVVCLSTPAWFGGVGQFYRDFTQVSDEEVLGILEEFA